MHIFNELHDILNHSKCLIASDVGIIPAFERGQAAQNVAVTNGFVTPAVRNASIKIIYSLEVKRKDIAIGSKVRRTTTPGHATPLHSHNTLFRYINWFHIVNNLETSSSLGFFRFLAALSSNSSILVS